MQRAFYRDGPRKPLTRQNAALSVEAASCPFAGQAASLVCSDKAPRLAREDGLPYRAKRHVDGMVNVRPQSETLLAQQMPRRHRAV